VTTFFLWDESSLLGEYDGSGSRQKALPVPVQGDPTIAELVRKYGVNASQDSDWGKVAARQYAQASLTRVLSF